MKRRKRSKRMRWKRRSVGQRPTAREVKFADRRSTTKSLGEVLAESAFLWSDMAATPTPCRRGCARAGPSYFTCSPLRRPWEPLASVAML